MVEPVAEATEEELFVTSPALFSKLLIRRCDIGSLKRKTCFLQNNYKSLAKPFI